MKRKISFSEVAIANLRKTVGTRIHQEQPTHKEIELKPEDPFYFYLKSPFQKFA
jgi:hypothetical protein